MYYPRILLYSVGQRFCRWVPRTASGLPWASPLFWSSLSALPGPSGGRPNLLGSQRPHYLCSLLLVNTLHSKCSVSGIFFQPELRLPQQIPNALIKLCSSVREWPPYFRDNILWHVQFQALLPIPLSPSHRALHEESTPSTAAQTSQVLFPPLRRGMHQHRRAIILP